MTPTPVRIVETVQIQMTLLCVTALVGSKSHSVLKMWIFVKCTGAWKCVMMESKRLLVNSKVEFVLSYNNYNSVCSSVPVYDKYDIHTLKGYS